MDKFLLLVEGGDDEYYGCDYFAFECEDKDAATLALLDLVKKAAEQYQEQQKEAKAFWDLRDQIIKVGPNHDKYNEQCKEWADLRGTYITKSVQFNITFYGHELNWRDFVTGPDMELIDPKIVTLEDFWRNRLGK